MTTLPNMNIVLPTLGGDIGNWDDLLNAALGLVDAHNHTSGKGVAIGTAAISIDADLAFGGWGITGLGKLLFNAVTALSSGSKALFVSSADNELYWRTNGGSNVKLTDGASINTSLVGGIVGDYSSVGAEVAYDDANDIYTFKQEGSNPWARIACGGLRIFEFNTVESVYVQHLAPSALASSYDVTWPLALPASTALCQITAAGVMTFTNTIVEAITAPDYLHPGRTATMPVIPTSASTSVTLATGAPHLCVSTGTPFAWYTMGLGALGLREGDVVTNVRLRFSGNDGSSLNLYVHHFRHDTGDASTGPTSSTAASGHIEVVPTSGKNTIEIHDTMLDTMYIRVDGSSATAVTMELDVTWTHPTAV